MAWYRRDTATWGRTPIHRYARRSLRDHEFILRNRGFCRSQVRGAQHRDGDDNQRPAGLSNIEWMQLQNHRRIKRLLYDEPYRALFGASNDMLKGRGLVDWDWIYKASPKWMLREMKPENAEQEPGKKFERKRTGEEDTDADRNSAVGALGKKDSPAHPGSASPQRPWTYPRKVEILRDQQREARASLFPEPSFRTKTYERDEYHSGVASPSDLRRPREETPSSEVIDNTSRTSPSDSPRSNVTNDSNAMQLRDSPPSQLTSVSTHNEMGLNTPAWRQTAIERRLKTNLNKKERDTETTPSAVSSNQSRFGRTITASRDLPSMRDERNCNVARSGLQNENWTSSIPRAPRLDQKYAPTDTFVNEFPLGTEDLVPNEHQKSAPGANIESDTKHHPRALHNLPEDDLDLITADDIRASMGTRNSEKHGKEEKHEHRNDLEKKYEALDIGPSELDPDFETRTLNNQRLRQMTQMLGSGKESMRTGPGDRELKDQEDLVEAGRVEEGTTAKPPSDASTWTSNLTKLFWSGPISEKDATLARDYPWQMFSKALKAHRKAMILVEDELESVLPASKPLLTRWEENERKLVRSVDVIIGESFRANSAPVPLNAYRKLREERKKIDEELDNACKSFDAVKNSLVWGTSDSMKRRLRNCEKTLQLNVQLLTSSDNRFSRIKKTTYEAGTAGLLERFTLRLHALRDTQDALLKLVRRAIVSFGTAKEIDPNIELHGVSPILIPGLTAGFEDAAPISSEDKTSTVGSARGDASEQILRDEVEAQKSAMRGLSDDGYLRPPRAITKKPFQNPNPLAHSLFRPFAPQIENLGKEIEVQSEAKELQAKRDERLIKEIKASYEDVYGPISLEHRQADSANVSEASASPKNAAESLELQDGTHEHGATEEAAVEPTTAAEYNTTREAETKPAEQADTISKLEVSDEHISSSEQATAPKPINHRILTYDPAIDDVHIVTTSSAVANQATTPILLHEALIKLEVPARFIPHLLPDFEIISSSANVLVLRQIDGEPIETISTTTHNGNVTREESWDVNPVDGMTRLSPTDYIGVEPDLREELRNRHAAKEREKLAEEQEVKDEDQRWLEKLEGKSRRKRRSWNGAASVFKTAIFVGAGCYLAGVFAELRQ